MSKTNEARGKCEVSLLSIENKRQANKADRNILKPTN